VFWTTNKPTGEQRDMNTIMLCKIINLKSGNIVYSANPDVAQEFTGKEYIIFCKTYSITGSNIYKT
jgi:hypothetical protein